MQGRGVDLEGARGLVDLQFGAEALQAALGPREGLLLLLVGNEVSGTTAIFQINLAY